MTKSAFLVVGLGSLVFGCAATADDASDLDEAEVAAQEGGVTVANCGEAAIRWSTPASALEFIARGLNWVHANVPYSQTETCTFPAGDCVGSPHWRKDCSGYASMMWNINPNSGFSTADFAGGAGVDNLAGWGELTPGDALLVHNAAEHHVMIFGGFIAGSNGGEFCALEEHSGGASVSRYNKGDCSNGCGVHFNDFVPRRLTGYAPSGFTGALESDTATAQWKKCADITGGNPAEWDCNGGNAQQWVADGNLGWGAMAKIKNQDTGACLSPATLTGGAFVNNVACDDTVSKQRWRLDSKRLKVGTLGCLAVNTSFVPWRVVIDACGNTADRSWDYLPATKALQITVNGVTKCLDAANGLEGTFLSAANCGPTDGGQNWNRTNGGFTTAFPSGRCVDGSGQRAKLSACDGSEGQRIALRGFLRNGANDTLCLAHESGAGNGNRLNIKACNGMEDAQVWTWWSKQ